MDFISRVEDGFVWLYCRGVYKQAELYRRGNQLYAKVGSGYVRLAGNRTTSQPKTIWLDLDPGCAVLQRQEGHPPLYLHSQDVSQLSAPSTPPVGAPN